MHQVVDEHPLLLPLVGVASGIWGGHVWFLTPPWWLAMVVFGGLLFVSGLRWQRLFQVCLLFFCVVWGVAALQPMRTAVPSWVGIQPLAGQLVVEGLVVSRPLQLSRGQRFELQLEQIIGLPVGLLDHPRLLVTVAEGAGTWLTGDRIRLQGRLEKPRKLGLPGEFDYPSYLALRGIAATLWVPSADQVVLMRSAVVPGWRRLLDQAALRCNHLIRASVPDQAAAAVLEALVTGSQSAVPSDLREAYGRSGVTHILSISGFHVAIIAATVAQLLLMVLLRWEWLALRINLRRLALLLTLPVMVAYLLFTGAAPATARSVVMLAAVVLALWVERESDVLDALLLAALLLLVASPRLLFDLSFQLSFLSLWGIVVLTPLLLAPLKPYLAGWRHTVALFFAASLAAILATAVPTLVSFHQASVTGLLANLVAVPLLGYGAVVLGTAAVPLVQLFPAVAGWLFGLAGWLVTLSNQFIVWVAELPVLRSYQFGPVDLAVSIAVLAVVSFVRSPRLRLSLVGLLVGLACVVHLWPAAEPDGRLQMTFLSVGQGDATLIRFPDRSTMLIDGGGYLRDTGNDFGQRYLVPALYALGVSRIDRLVLTHPHPDHLGGLPAVAGQFPIGEFWHGPGVAAAGGTYERLLRQLADRRVPVRELTAGGPPLDLADSSIQILAPVNETDRQRGRPDDNEDSLVLRLVYRNFSALMMADAGQATERALLAQGVLQPSTLLKVGHHGSRSATGEPFIHRVRPALAVISVGAGNRFGLPAESVVARLLAAGTRLYRTDRDGTLMIESDGDHYRVVSGLERR